MIRHLAFKRDFHPFTMGEAFDLKPITVLTGDQGAGKSTLLDLIIKYEEPKLAAVNDRYRNKFNDKVGDDGFVTAAGENNLLKLEYDGELRLVYVDTEKHNPRMTSGETTKEYKDAIIEVLRDEALYKLIQVMEGYKSMGFKFKSDSKTMEVNEVTNNLLEKLGLYFDSKRGGTILGDEIKMDVATTAVATMQSHGQSIFPLLQKSTEGATGAIIMLDEPETALSIRSQNKIAKIILDLAKNNQVIVATHSPIIMAITDEVLSLEHRRWMKREEFVETQTQLVTA